MLTKYQLNEVVKTNNVSVQENVTKLLGGEINFQMKDKNER